MKTKHFFVKIILFLIAVLFTMSCNKYEGKKLRIFAGTASMPATDEIVKLFKEATGADVEVIYGSSGEILNQMQLGKTGDIFFPGSSDYMEKAKELDFIFPETEKIVCYLVPAINVQKGNPKFIKSLKDLLEPGLKIAIANPESVCVGAYAQELINANFTREEQKLFEANLINYTGSCEKTATAVSMKTVDAVIGWSVFEYWDSNNIETVKLPASEIVRVGYIPVAITKFCKNRELAQEFINYIYSEFGRQVFGKHHYITKEEEVFEYVGEKKPVGNRK